MEGMQIHKQGKVIMAILFHGSNHFLVHGAALVFAFLIYHVPRYTQLVLYLSPSSKNDYYPLPIFWSCLRGLFQLPELVMPPGSPNTI